MAWHCPEGMTVTYAKSDPQVGGKYVVNMVEPDGSEHRAVGTYLEVSRYDKLAFTWDWEVGGDPAKGSQVTVTFKELDSNRTEMTLYHERISTKSSRDGHIGGWTGALNNLEHLLSQ